MLTRAARAGVSVGPDSNHLIDERFESEPAQGARSVTLLIVTPLPGIDSANPRAIPSCAGFVTPGRRCC
jgi:hypothetical protein